MEKTLIEKDLAKERLEKYLATHKVKIAHKIEDLYVHSVKDDNGEEVDEFLRIREQWREEDRERSLD